MFERLIAFLNPKKDTQNNIPHTVSSRLIPEQEPRENPEPTRTMETQVEKLCSALNVDTRIFNDTEIKNWLDQLDNYAKTHDRLLYATISNYIFTLNDDSYETFSNNLRHVYEYSTKANVPTDQTQKKQFLKLRTFVTKFYDHVNLARSQSLLLTKAQEKLDDMIQSKVNLEWAKLSTDLTSQLVGLIALFTALSFIVFGGISSLESIFTALSQRSNAVLPTILVAIIWAFCMMNLLFLFMYFVLRIMGTKKEDSIQALIKKHPLIFICNYILLSLLLFLGSAHYAWITGLGRGIYDWVLSISDWAFILGFALIAGIIFFSGRLLYNAINPKEE